MRTLLIALGASLAMTASALAMEGGCMGSKAYTADAGKHSKPTTSQTAEASTPDAPVQSATRAPKTADADSTVTTPKTPS